MPPESDQLMARPMAMVSAGVQGWGFSPSFLYSGSLAAAGELMKALAPSA